MKFDDGTQCHWSYRIGRYESPWNYETKEAAQASAGGVGEVFLKHGTACTCAPDPWWRKAWNLLVYGPQRG